MRRYCPMCEVWKSSKVATCEDCGERTIRERDVDFYTEEDEAYERAAARSRGIDFADNGGKDWT